MKTRMIHSVFFLVFSLLAVNRGYSGIPDFQQILNEALGFGWIPESLRDSGLEISEAGIGMENCRIRQERLVYLKEGKGFSQHLVKLEKKEHREIALGQGIAQFSASGKYIFFREKEGKFGAVYDVDREKNILTIDNPFYYHFSADEEYAFVTGDDAIDIDRWEVPRLIIYRLLDGKRVLDEETGFSGDWLARIVEDQCFLYTLDGRFTIIDLLSLKKTSFSLRPWINKSGPLRVLRLHKQDDILLLDMERYGIVGINYKTQEKIFEIPGVWTTLGTANGTFLIKLKGKMNGPNTLAVFNFKGKLLYKKETGGIHIKRNHYEELGQEYPFLLGRNGVFLLFRDDDFEIVENPEIKAGYFTSEGIILMGQESLTRKIFYQFLKFSLK